MREGCGGYMPPPIKPWEPANIPDEVQAELNRRKYNRGFNYIKAEKGEWGGTSGEFTKYKGPMSPWVRFCSNGKGSDAIGKPGFVFFSGKTFYSGYGFNQNSSGGNQIIGYLPDGKNTHTISNDLNSADYPIHVPPPEIEKVTVKIQKELFRQASVEWVCFSKMQLEYMTPYFLVPGITCVLEWGWNHYNPESLLHLDNVSELKQFFKNPYPLYTDHIIKSNGNYDVLLGIVTNFEWTVDGNKIKCKTEITSKDRIYAGLLTENHEIDKSGGKASEKPLDNLPEFVDQVLPRLKELATKAPDAITLYSPFCSYLRRPENHPDNWMDYATAAFWGRDPETQTPFSDKANKMNDFDHINPYANMWISVGLLIEIINYHASDLTGVAKEEMFRIDIDDTAITAHPNMISSDGSVLLIPNKFAPHYHSGNYGEPKSDAGEYGEMKACDSSGIGGPSDIQLQAVTQGGVKRDDHDKIINWVRHKYGVTKTEFPFTSDNSSEGPKPYPAKYSGWLKNLYFNVAHFKSLVSKDSGVKSYANLVEKIMEDINKSCGNFWDFRLVAGTGKKSSQTKQSVMKVMDYRFMMSANSGTKVYSFDYMDQDSLLLGLSFKPTLSNAQAIRTIYSQVNNTKTTKPIQNGEDELLDYKFRDRLFEDSVTKTSQTSEAPKTSKWDETMRELQMVKPKEGSFQMTTPQGVRRLVLPEISVLNRLLDDDDFESNPKYTGIMPGIQSSFTIQGIGGLRTFMMFLVWNLPRPYSEKNIIFRIVNLTETIDNAQWITTIEAGIVPLRNSVKQRLGIK